MKTLVVLGGGFAGVWSALSARAFQEKHSTEKLNIKVISNNDYSGIRPRFYEADLEATRIPLKDIFKDVDIEHLRATVTGIDPKAKIVSTDRGNVAYDALIYALGSKLFVPKNLDKNKLFSVDSLEDAHRLDQVLREKSSQELSIVIGGGGFTGIELAMELPVRLRGMNAENFKIHLVEMNPKIAPEYGEKARAHIEKALSSENIRIHTGVALDEITSTHVHLSNGTKIPADIVAWTAGVRPSTIATEISRSLDRIGRILVDSYLQVPEYKDIWAAGDVAAPLTDETHFATMSCQHAIPQGKLAGYNAAASLSGKPQKNYEQYYYATCLDLGDWGALLTHGWERNRVIAVRKDAKDLKITVNRHVIYPPVGDRRAKLKAAVPEKGGWLIGNLTDFALSIPLVRKFGNKFARG